MKRPLLVWFAFAACVAVGFGVLGWFTREMVRLDRETAEARRLAAREEAVRLALWRMDSALAGVHGLEASRPAQDYEAFHPADSAFSSGLSVLAPHSVWVPSPLLRFTPPFVKLHFQIEPDGSVRSPQAPERRFESAALAAGASRDQLQNATNTLRQLAGRIAADALFAEVLSGPPAVGSLSTDAPTRDEAEVDRLVDDKAVGDDLRGPQELAVQPRQIGAPLAFEEQKSKSVAEQRQRAELYAQQNTLSPAAERRAKENLPASSSSSTSFFRKNAPPPTSTTTAAAAPAQPPAPLADAARMDRDAEAAAADAMEGRTAGAAAAEAASMATPTAIAEDTLRAVWSDGELLFVRRASIGERAVAQGAWLDWPEIEAWLLSRVADLLPAARLERGNHDGGSRARSASGTADPARRLAFLPVYLVPGPFTGDGVPAWSPLRVSLAAAWVSAVVGAAALALLLRGTLLLSERRGAFVSAVTHELRTPLTTFRMYTEMLTSGMVRDEERQRSYLDTLRTESERLAHLVENVLSYSRIERGRAASRVETTTPAALVARIEPRLRERLAQGGLTLQVDIEPALADLPLHTDTTAVEQVIFNLVDNATKYGRPAQAEAHLPAEVVLSVAAHGHGRGRIAFRVTDHGPGLPAAARKRLFQPFSKSAHEAAQTQPGVGLGLALCRRLAREELGGDLVFERNGPGGTVFRLEVPRG